MPNEDPRLVQTIHFEFGKTYDQMHESDNAFKHFVQGNRHLSLINNTQGTNKENYLSMLDDLHDQFSSDWAARWRTCPIESSDQEPIFLVGFPRSGTTLLDQILDSHAKIHVIEEQPMVEVLRAQISELPDGYPQSLWIFDRSDIQQLRLAYYSLLNKFNASKKDPIGPDKQIVDKNPLNLIHIGLIKKIFPRAQFILAVRHPCDVVLSCFMQSFSSNDAMANYHCLADGAHLYDRVMSLWIKYTKLLALECHADYHIVKYEQLVDNFEPEIRRLFAFLRVDWDDNVLDYSGHARQRKRINTPSYNQVTRPIYQDAKYRWLRYAKYLRPVLQNLEPYINHFEYPSLDESI